jgi:hypothetical protein
VIWGNVSTNVLLTLLSDAVLAGLSAFFFSAVVITLLCEIIPQAYFSRNALQMTVCHERTDARRCDAVQEMEVGPPEPAVRGRLQTTASCDGQEPWW